MRFGTLRQPFPRRLAVCATCEARTECTLAEHRKLQFFRWPEPDYMIGVVSFVVSCGRVGEDRQTIPIQYCPVSESAKLLSLQGELTTAPRVRADGMEMEVPDRQVEAPAGRIGESARPFDLFRIEVDVRVKIENAGHAC